MRSGPIRRIAGWTGWLVAGLVGLIFLLTLVFYLMRGMIKDRVLEKVNAGQPGQVSIGQIDLIPFLNFPDISMRVKNVNYSDGSMPVDSVPVIALDRLFVSLDVLHLIRGEYRVSSLRLGDGVVNYHVDADSVSNLERALGSRFGEAETGTDPEREDPGLSLDMKRIEISNVRFNYSDAIMGTEVSAGLNALRSRFSYLEDKINAGVDLDLDLHSARYGDVVMNRRRHMQFRSDVMYDVGSQRVSIDPSELKIADALLEVWGEIIPERGNYVDVTFRARNSGLELLNFLFRGVLDLEELEQTGDGKIYLSGTVKGSMDYRLPEVKANFSASQVGFHIRSIDKEVEDITFIGYATNGRKADLSEAALIVEDFHVSFPTGALDAEFSVENAVTPTVSAWMQGSANLSVLEQIVTTNAVSNLEGALSMDGSIDGMIDREAGSFLENAGNIALRIDDVSFSFPGHRVEELEGTLKFEESWLAMEQVTMYADSNRVELEGKIDRLIPTFFGFEQDPLVSLQLEADTLYAARFISDTTLAHFLREPLHGIGFEVEAGLTYEAYRQMISSGSVPNMDLQLDNFHLQLPGYADISRMRFGISLRDGFVEMSDFQGRIGESRFDLDARVDNYIALLEGDTADIGLDITFRSDLMQARDLFTYRDQFFILPETYRNEHMEDFLLEASLQTTTDQLMKKSGLPDMRFRIGDMHWKFRYYPLNFREFRLDLEHRDSVFIVHHFEGKAGYSDLKMNASIAHLLDSTRNIAGEVTLLSDRLDFNNILNYNQPGAGPEETGKEPQEHGAPPALHAITYPDLQLGVDVKELHYADNHLYGMDGQMRSSSSGVFYLDRFRVQAETGGTILLDGQLNVSDSSAYLLSANFNLDSVNLSDFNLRMSLNDSIYSLNQNFEGILDASGLAEFFMNPDMTIDLENSTAMFKVSLEEGRVKNFAPLHAMARYTGNKDLDDVRFGELHNNFTLIDKKIVIPLMNISSTLGQILIEGEQGLEGDFLYLVRVPVWLVKGTAWNVISNKQRRETEEEGEIREMKAGKFMLFTVNGEGEEVEVKIGDDRDKFR